LNAILDSSVRMAIDRSKVFLTFSVTVMPLHELSCTVLPYRIFYAMEKNYLYNKR